MNKKVVESFTKFSKTKQKIKKRHGPCCCEIYLPVAYELKTHILKKTKTYILQTSKIKQKWVKYSHKY